MQQGSCNPRVSADFSPCQERLRSEIACLASAMAKGAAHGTCPAQPWAHAIYQKLIGRREAVLHALNSVDPLLPAGTPLRSG